MRICIVADTGNFFFSLLQLASRSNWTVIWLILNVKRDAVRYLHFRTGPTRQNFMFTLWWDAYFSWYNTHNYWPHVIWLIEIYWSSAVWRICAVHENWLLFGRTGREKIKIVSVNKYFMHFNCVTTCACDRRWDLYRPHLEIVFCSTTLFAIFWLF